MQPDKSRLHSSMRHRHAMTTLSTLLELIHFTVQRVKIGAIQATKHLEEAIEVLAYFWVVKITKQGIHPQHR